MKYSPSPSPTSSGLPLRAATIARDHRDPVRALHSRERLDHRLLQIPLVHLFDQMRENLGIGVRPEAVAELLERLPQCGAILDDAVVHDTDLLIAAHLRMRIDEVRRTVRRPSRVRDAERSDDRRGSHESLELGDLSRRLSSLEPLPVHDGDASRVIASVLEAPEPLEEQWRGRAWSNVSYDSAHIPRSRKMSA
jgi:hypothetical protein